MSANTIVVGVFKDEALAENAIDVLRNADFSYDQISYARCKSSWEMKRILDNLVKIGISEEETSYYESEFEAGRSIVLVMHDGRLGEVLNILFLNGTRKHRYLNRSGYVDKNVLDVSVATKNELDNSVETSQSFLSNNPVTNPAACNSEMIVQDEMASLRKLLKDVGLDHLL
ncbi:MAG: hypothetical protein NVSMB33_10170 [Ktedonobacteraceae bacterium]